MALSDQIRISDRYRRSIRIDTDLGDPKILEGFICPRTSAEVLLSMANNISKTGQGAFTWTGPYGSGKSSLIVALGALLNVDQALKKQAAKIFGKKVVSSMSRALPAMDKGWRIVSVIGRRASAVDVIGEALKTAKIVKQTPKKGWSEEDIINTLTKAVGSASKSKGGVVLFIDEMGKFLEVATRDGTDIYIFQQLAELAARSDGRLLIVGVLHQAFEEYGQRLSREIRDEWSKIQGRFIDLAVNATGEEQLDLIARAIKSDRKTGKLSPEAHGVAKMISRSSQDTERLGALLDNCWPLHPVTACLLGPFSRRRFGQNQRSIFGFLNSAEPCGFQDFISYAEDGALYTPDLLWDYLRINLESSILASSDGSRWALATEAISRCENTYDDGFPAKLLKVIAITDFFKDRSGLAPSIELLRLCFPGKSKKDIVRALDALTRQSFLILKKFIGAYAIYAGSDFDIDRAVQIVLDEVEDIDFTALKNIAGLHSILAKRHYHKTGTMRWFDVNICPLHSVAEDAATYKPSNGICGQFLLAIPDSATDDKKASKICKEAVCKSDEGIVVGVSDRAWAIAPLARELLALDKVKRDCPELAGDAVARRELDARIKEVGGQVEAELRRAFDNAKWHHQDEPKSKLYQYAELSRLASDIADKRFADAPILHNELLNRQKPSTSAASAQKLLLRCMVDNEGQERLGIKGYPAERGLFVSLLENTGLYKKRKGKDFQFCEPSDKDAANLAPAWRVAEDLLCSRQNELIEIAQLYDEWRKPPFGIKDGLMPILAVAFILSKQKKVAIYRDKIFRSQFNDVDIDYLVKDAKFIQLRWIDFSKDATRLLSGMGEIVQDLDTTDRSIGNDPIDVARGLVGIYEQLPQWTKRTMTLSKGARDIRDLFKQAKDPNRMLFDDLPSLMKKKTGSKALNGIISDVRRGLGELVHAYPKMLQELRDLMLKELQVMNASPQALEGLRMRAENIRNLSGDLRFNAFVGRLSQFRGDDKSFESIASLIANKPPQDWNDATLDDVKIDFAKLSREFRELEALAHVKGRKDKREIIAVVIGMDGEMHQEFDVADAEQKDVKTLQEELSATLEKADIKKQNLILAALARVIAEHLDGDAKIEAKLKPKKRK